MTLLVESHTNTSRVAYQVHFPTSVCEHCIVGDGTDGEVLKGAIFFLKVMEIDASFFSSVRIPCLI